MAAPQMPEGRRPVWIQSRFMEATRRSAVLATCQGRRGEGAEQLGSHAHPTAACLLKESLVYTIGSE